MIEWIRNLRSTEKGKTLFKFILYLIFLFFVVILCLVAGAMGNPYTDGQKGESTNEESSILEEKTLTYFEKQELLKSGKYEFEYNIHLADEDISFLGDYDAGWVDGYKETTDNLIHFKIEDGITYRMTLSEKVEISDLNGEVDLPLFELDKIFMVLNGTESSIGRDGKYKTYSYTLEDSVYRVTTDDNCIRKIDIARGEDKYELIFKF